MAVTSVVAYAGQGANDASVGTLAWRDAFQLPDLGETTVFESASAGWSASNYLLATDFGFAIPGGATILGIEVVANVRNNVASYPSAVITDNAIRIVKGGSIGAADQGLGTDWSTTLEDRTWGGSTNLWGETWTTANINATNFGVAISAADNSGGTSGGQGRILYVKVTVYYDDSTVTPNWTPSIAGHPIASFPIASVPDTDTPRQIDVTEIANVNVSAVAPTMVGGVEPLVPGVANATVTAIAPTISGSEAQVLVPGVANVNVSAVAPTVNANIQRILVSQAAVATVTVKPPCVSGGVAIGSATANVYVIPRYMSTVEVIPRYTGVVSVNPQGTPVDAACAAD